VGLVTTENLGPTQAVVSSVPLGSINVPAGQPVAGLVQVAVPGLGPAAIDHATITFEVSRGWLTAHGLTPTDITGAYDNNGVWSSLPTTYTGDSGNACTFTMTTQALGYFAITVFKTGTVPGINPGTSATVTNFQSYPVGFSGLTFNADGQSTLSIDLAAAKTAGATVTTYFNRVEVYQHHSPGVTLTFWGDHFTLQSGSITGPVTRAEFVTDPLNAKLAMGNVSGSVRAALPVLTQRTLMNNTISQDVDTDTTRQFKEILGRNHLGLNTIAYTLEVKKVNLTTGPANITFTIPATWVNLHGGTNAVHITRISEETGKTELLATTYLGLDAQDNMIFRGDSPNGTSLFGLLTAEATAVEQKEHPNVTYIPASKPAMITNVGIFGWLAGIIQNNPVLLVGIIALFAVIAYFGWWRRRL
jgi:PGF-pre-PGF domain-containing protein